MTTLPGTLPTPLPSALFVGAASASVLGPQVHCVPSVRDAAPFLSNPEITLVLVDTAPTDGPLSRADAVRIHADAGGRIFILIASLVPAALIWTLKPDLEHVRFVAAAIELPVEAAVLARLLHLDAPAPEVASVEITPDVPLTQIRSADNPITGYKAGKLWWDESTGRVLVSGAFVDYPGPRVNTATCEEADKHRQHENGIPWVYDRCYAGFNAWQQESQALA